MGYICKTCLSCHVIYILTVEECSVYIYGVSQPECDLDYQQVGPWPVIGCWFHHVTSAVLSLVGRWDRGSSWRCRKCKF